ncbi:MAG: hypothetical protein FVQ81_01615 [Candidatus Glassbacteria bacterium]|nr:hypothetical protein [Candidatus Glassbacteria bacterium]
MNMAWCALAVAGPALAAWEVWRSTRIGFRRLEIPLQSHTCRNRGAVRILHLSDLHITASLRHKLDRIESLLDGEWDFVMISGDLIDNDSGIDPVSDFLGRLKASCGKFAVLGNHDYLDSIAGNPLKWVRAFWHALLNRKSDELHVANDINRLVGCLEERGVRLLRNELAEGEIPGAGPFQVFGIDDPATDRDRPAEVSADVNPDALRLVLTHAPIRLGPLARFAPELIMCGHTHGGQIRLPLLGAILTHSDAGRRSCSGLVELDGCRVHISPGVGAGRLFPLRFFSKAEVTEIVLKASDRDI